MAQIVSVRLSRTDTSPWGFRLQGGKDFGQPLLIQKVNGGSLAEKAGLQVGDALVRVNNVDVQDLRHKDAQDTIVRAGNSFEVQVQRGGASTWKPQVSPVGQVPSPGGRSPHTVTKTSLAAKPSAVQIPTGHNVSPKPFGPSSTPQAYRKGFSRKLPRHFTPMNGGDSVKAIVNKQYNTPVGMYSEETIAETLSAQAEVLAGGVLGVNFMKNEKSYDSQKSEVFKMLQEAEKEPREPEPASLSNTKYYSTTSHAVGGRATSPRPLTPIARQMGVPELPQDKPYLPPQSPLPGGTSCSFCGKQIVGVFVRIKDKNLHVECFKCATCGTSLKNVGYYNINNKLYCDIHAKLVARQNPPAPNLEPVTVPPGGRVPSGTFTIPSVTTALPSKLPTAAPQSPPGTIAPMPFHTSNTPGPKPFGSQPAAPPLPSSVPFSAPPPPTSAPYCAPAPPVSNISTPKPQTELKQPVIWPPLSTTSESKEPSMKKPEKVKIIESVKQESKIPVVNVEDVDEKFDKNKRMSLCSEEVKHISDKKIEKFGLSSLYESVGNSNRPASPIPDREITFSLVDEISKAQARSRSEEKRQIVSRKVYEQQSLNRSEMSRSMKEESQLSTSSFVNMECAETRTVGGLRRSVSPDILDISTKPHEVRSLLPPASAVRPLSPLQVVVFPPEIPEVMRSRSSSPQPPAVTELIVRYTPSPVPHITEDKQRKTIAQEEALHLKEKKDYISKEDRISVSEKKSSKKEKKVQEKHKDEKIQIKEKNKLSEKETQQRKTEEKIYTKSEVERIVQEEVKKMLMASEKKIEIKEKQESKVVGVNDLPSPIIESGKMASALTTAPERPFTPVPFPKALEIPSAAPKPLVIKWPVSKDPVPLPPYSKPYFPPPPPPPENEKEDESVARALREVGCRSPMTEALTIAPDRPYSPLPAVPKLDTITAFKPISDIPKNKKPMTMLSALTVAPAVPFTLPGKTPIPSESGFEEENQNKTTPSAFKPLNGSVSCVIPKTAPLNKDLPVPYIPHPKVDSKFGMDRSLVKEPGLQKEVIKGFESTTAVSDKSSYSRKSEFICESSKTQSQNQREIPKEVSRSVTTAHPKPSSGLHSPSLLPYYQQNIGEIPVRNRSISPVPHPIRAPALTPSQIPPPSVRSPITTPRITTKTSSSAIHQKHQTYDKSHDSHYQKATCSESSRLSTERTATTKTITNISKTKQVFKPETPSRQLSPHWRGEYVRAVQNLSPITVRLPSPQPRPSKPIGETSQEAGAKIKIKKSRGQSPVVTFEEDTRHHSSSTKTTASKGCSSGKGCSGQEGCPENEACKKSGSGEKHGSSSTPKTLDVSKESLKTSKSSQQKHYQTQQLLQTEEVQQNKQIQQHTQKTHQTQLYQQKQVMSEKHQLNSASSLSQKQKQLTASDSSKDKISDSQIKKYSSTSTSKLAEKSNNLQNKSQDKSRFSYSSGNYAKTSEKCEFQSGFPNSTTYPKTIKSNDPDSLTSSRGLCGVNPSSSGGHAGGGGVGSGGPGSGKSGSVAGSTAPRRGRGVLNTSVPPGGRIPLCGHCNTQIRGPFITALGKIWCPEHFVCVNSKCRRPLQDIGFVEEADGLYCEYCFEQYLAPTCDKCNAKIKGDCLNAIGKHFHPECFRCAYCEKLFGNNPFFLEDALPYCETDWNELFTTKCFSCGFPIEAGDRWVEALSNNYHSQCFNCTMCKKNLEGQSFYAKGGRPYCKNHAR
ncbi:Z band alternatively spliced PDZ-motif protein 52 isoform X4 [Rhodnius prolixus]|uniref:Z band alternatively spliced PDZ-motif protein 52 isoform X4 n=1 Tax=Rhodnius prolixus TaxID=13249 RepID=UPI003D18C32E